VSSAGWKVGDKEEFVEAGGKGSNKGIRAMSMCRKSRRYVICRGGIHGSKGWELTGTERVKKNHRSSSTGRVVRTVRGEQIREPDLTVLLNVQVMFEGAVKWGISMVEQVSSGH
jgi:hypothetical protein